MTDSWGWKAHTQVDLNTGRDQIALVRHMPNGESEFVTGFDHGIPEITRLPHGERLEREPWITLPDGALAALVEAVKPGPARESMALVEEALWIERSRVDRVLDELTRRPLTPVHDGDEPPF